MKKHYLYIPLKDSEQQERFKQAADNADRSLASWVRVSLEKIVKQELKP